MTEFRDETARQNNIMPGLSQEERLDLDLALYGNAYTVGGRRVPPEDVVVHTAYPDFPAPTIRTQADLLTALDELLDAALHDEHCYVNPNDTVCVCVIGRVRAVLPPCGAVRPAPGTGGRRMWPCLRSSHPAAPDQHYFGEA